MSKKLDLKCEDCSKPLSGLDMKYCEDCRLEHYDGGDGFGSCIDEMECPACGEIDSFNIESTRFVTVTHDGTGDDEGGDTEWDEDSRCECGECGHSGTVKNFNSSNEVWQSNRKQALTELAGDKSKNDHHNIKEPLSSLAKPDMRQHFNDGLEVAANVLIEESACGEVCDCCADCRQRTKTIAKIRSRRK